MKCTEEELISMMHGLATETYKALEKGTPGVTEEFVRGVQNTVISLLTYMGVLSMEEVMEVGGITEDDLEKWKEELED